MLSPYRDDELLGEYLPGHWNKKGRPLPWFHSESSAEFLPAQAEALELDIRADKYK